MQHRSRVGIQMLVALLASLVLAPPGCSDPVAAVVPASQLGTAADSVRSTTTLPLDTAATAGATLPHDTATPAKPATGGSADSVMPARSNPATAAQPTVHDSATPPPEPMLVLSARSADDFVNSIGVNIHLGYWDTPYGGGYESIIKPRLLELGVRHARDAGTVVSDDAWMRSVYGRMQELAAAGIRFDLIMQPAQGVTDFTALPAWNRLMGFVGNAAESFEGLNEHDLSGRPGWVSETRAFQFALFAAARADSRTASLPVLGPSMGHAVNAALLGTLGSAMDVGNMHPYPGGALPLANLGDALQRLAPVDGNHPVMVTETGYHTATLSTSDHPAVPEAAMARYIPRLVLDNFAAGIARSYLYELIDEGTNLAEQEQNFGLLHHDGSPKPAFTALRNLIALLADPGGSGAAGSVLVSMSGDTLGVTHLALVKRDGRQYLVLWQEASSYNLITHTLESVPVKNVTLRFAAPVGLRVFDPLMSSSPLSSQRVTSQSVAVPDSPIVIEITR